MRARDHPGFPSERKALFHFCSVNDLNPGAKLRNGSDGDRMNKVKWHVGTFGSLLVRAVIGLAFFAILLCLPRTASAAPLFPQCPAIGADTGCAILITINADGSVTTTTDGSQGAFDRVDDTLIGVQNNTTLTSVPNITVSSASAIFALDGDGLCNVSPHPAGCPFGSTRYEGPMTSFTIGSLTSGTVNFLSGGIPPGGSAYFSLEEPLTAASISVAVELAVSNATGVPVTTTEGTLFSGAIATFRDAAAGATASEYSATIDWGDSSTSTGTVSGSASPFTVSGSHTYSDEGTFTVTVTINDIDNSLNTAKVNTTATVADGALNSACTVPPNTLQSFNGSTATFVDQNPLGTIGNFSATINWGDSTTSTGSITGAGGTSPYTVKGSHTYASTGFFDVFTKIVDDGGNTTTATCNRTLVFAFAPGGGSFAIGDEESALGTSVNFWGAQWAKNNPTTSHSKVSSFKGFAENPAAPSCGATWNTDPGNSTPPPDGPLPAFMGVIVTNDYEKSGSLISGDIPKIVVVKTNPGYKPDPGHRGTGTVLQQFCP
jgi:hypothetical protein